MPGNILVVNATPQECRVALVEQHVLTEFFVERRGERGIVGNIYKGKVLRVLPGMQAAFVDIGQDKAAFLYVSDVYNLHEEYMSEVRSGTLAATESAERSTAPTLTAPTPEERSLDNMLTEDLPIVGDDTIADVSMSNLDLPHEGGPTPHGTGPSDNTAGMSEDPASADQAASSNTADDPSTSAGTNTEDDDDGAPTVIPQSRGRHRPTGPIEERLHEGQEILVQVAKEPIGTKGARITSHITLPGRHLVHMPTFNHVGVSRRIEDEDERARLRQMVNDLRRPGTGFIVRTASEGITEPQLSRDIDYLTRLWRDVLDQFESSSAPSLLYEDLDLVRRAARDLFTEDIDALVIDDTQEYERTRGFVERFMPALVDTVECYEGEEPIFDAYGIEIEIERALGKKVWLKSGGYLVIEQTEALTAIDINTGKFVGKHTLEDTILQINLEAVKEIVYQLRLRNIGGLIIIDFIDMEKPTHRDRVFNTLEEALKKDKAKTNVLKISEFGLVEMTRKRVRESLVQTLCEPCAYCEGRGYTKSRRTVAYEILRQLRREVLKGSRNQVIYVTAHRDVAHLLYDEERQALEVLEADHGHRIEIRGNPDFHIEHYEIFET